MNNQRITHDWLILVTLASRFPASCRFWVSSCTIGWLNLVDLALRFLAFLHLLNVFTCHPSTPPDWFDFTIPCILAIPQCFNSRSFAFAKLHWVVKASIYCFQLTIPCVLAIQLCSGTTLPPPSAHREVAEGFVCKYSASFLARKANKRPPDPPNPFRAGPQMRSD